MYYLGFDGGGTKTDAAVLNAVGNVLGEGSAGPSNPLRVGYDSAASALAAAAEIALGAAHLEKKQMVCVCAALAGAGRPAVAMEMRRLLGAAFPGSLAIVVSDLDAALEAAAGAKPGVVLVAGTGSAAYGRNAAGETVRAGGYGPWIGDGGSAFDIGRSAVAASAHARDWGGSLGRLAEEILTPVHCADWNELIERVATNPDEIFPKIFPLVVQAADQGDGLARELLHAAAEKLAKLAEVVIRRLGLTKEEFVLAKTGGVFGHSSLLDEEVDGALTFIAPAARIEFLRTSAAIGAGRIARRIAGRK